MASFSPTSDIDFVINHLVLPPKLPHQGDSHNKAGLKALLDRVLSSAKMFRNQVDPKHYNDWSTICRLLTQFNQLHTSDILTKEALKRALDDVRQGGILVLHVSTQNAGIIIRKLQDDYHIEAFEASARAANVLASKNALEWHFPCRSVSVPAATFEDNQFQDQIAEFLEKCQMESIKQFAAITLKAGSGAYESRDTANPAMITEVFMALLQAVGRAESSKITQKRIRDDVCWNDGAEIPWRRSPTWLVLRVGLQRSLCFLLNGTLGTMHYKFFMAFVLQELCNEICIDHTTPTDNLALINAKLGRRMAKLHNESEQAPSSIRKDFEKMFDVFTKPCQKTLKISHDVVANRWADIRLKHTKRISRLPGRADTQSMFISLTNSQRYLNRVFEQLHGHSSTPAHLQYHNRVSIPSIGWAQISFKPEAILSDYLDFADFELQVERQGSRFVPNAATLQRDCVGLSKYITQYRLNATAVYNGNPQQLSIMLLTIMELWTVLDRAVLELYPILSEYPSGFPTAILHVLQLSRFQDLKRLRLIEAYLESRHRSTKKSAPSIFDDPVKGCFAVVYFDQSSAMKDLFAEIEESARAAYQKKVLELQRTTKEYDTLMKQAAEKTCICVEYDRSDGKCPPCNKCYVIRCARRLRISVHEHPLPSDAVQAKAVVFELLCPGPFAAWRDTTWGILRDLGRQHQFPGRKPELLLENYDQLRLYASHQNHTISLASKTKSFLHTHYATIRLPVTLDKVCLPNGLSYALFDHSKLLWCASQKETPTFADHCSHRISSTSVFASIDYALHSVNGISGRSSNEIIASQTKCPNTLTLAEYTAFQDLRVGVKLQWPRLLRELISSNLNFGLEEPASLVTQLALQVGPGNGDDVRRAAHWVFEDESFCMRLISLIDQRLDASAPNWRESQTVDCLVTLLLRTWSLARSASVVSATALVIAKARTISFHWARTLRNEVLTAKDGETAHQRSADAALAALLCRRTFAVEAEQDGRNLDVHGLATYFECAIILKENLPDDFQKASAKLRQKLVNNIKLFHRMEENLLQLKDMLQNAIKEALTNIWPEAENSIARTWSAWRLMPSPFHHWMIARTTPDEAFNAQEVHFNLLEGTLLIDGRPLGKLPAEYVSHEAFQHLFGNRTFWTYPSSLPGMSHVAANLVHGHQVHFGFRDGTTFIRVRENSTVMEFIPPTVFKGTGMAEASDFPRPLIDDVVHWLDLNSHTIKIRQMSDIWKPKHNNWSVDLKKRQARRNNSTLVDTRSRLFREIGSVIEPFESLPQIVVSQSDKGVLHVQLPRLELQFVVNKQGLLESRQMRAFIDSNQDCGTFYGLASKLVLCATDNPADRSVLVTLGVPTVNRHGAHVRVAVEHPLFYCRFPINTLLGRLEPAEPRLVYLKAYYHAVTSFVSPDPLTKRTGTEEALDCLQSALAQPWSPMDTIFCNILKSIAALTPRRNHYPQDLKAMQRVNWSDQLLAAVQDDRFRPAVHSIMRQSERLQHFHQIPLDSGEFETEGSTTLSQRSALRNATYQKSVACDVALTFDDEVYNTQDRFSTLRFNNILEAVSSVSRWSRQIRVTQDLAGLLQSWPVIQGFNQPFDISLLDELVNLDFKTNLGSLFDYCRQAEYTRDKHKMMFFFAVLSSNTKVDMTTIGTLIAFCILEEFKVLSGPMWSSYTQFKDNQVPTVDMLVNLMHESRTPYPETEHTAFQSKLSWRQRKQKEEDRSNHETQSLVSCKKLAQHLLGQWPCLNPALNKCGELPLIDLDEAVASVQTEWERHFQNYELSMFIRELQKVLRTCHPPTATACFGGLDFESEYYPIRSPGHVVPTIVELLAGITLPQLPSSERVKLSCLGDVLASRAADSLNSVDSVRNNDTTEASELRRVVKTFSNDSNSVRGKYGVDLEQSIDALTRNGSGEAACTNTVDQHRLQTAIADFDQAIHKHFNSLCAHLTLDSRFQWLGHTELWPLLTPITLLCTIRSNCAIKTVKQEAIVDYALLFRACQHLHRIRLASQQNNNFKLSEELCNIRHQNWEVRGSVDWLLLEIEFDICIRPAQYEVAKAMIAPYSGSNSVLQMNMGQGKSSVIIPMLAASLADGGSLVRVIVPKPLLSQMAQILQMRLGGLLGRTIKHVPFSRRSSTKPTDIQAYLDLHQETQLNRGVMLCLPEHLLSFKLSGLHSLSSRNATEAAPMINMQAWLIGNCRDVLDECDHTLAVKTQLIYPFGSQKVVDGHPNRWKIAEAILSLVRSHLPDLYKRFPGGLEIGWRAENAFPSICIIRQAVKDALIESVVSSVLNGQGSILPVKDCSQEDLDTMTSLLRDATIPKHIRRRAMDLFKDRPSARQDVLFLRGLLVHRILLMALNKRWNVQYGLHPKRDPIAVPYQAKGVPSEQAEFGHPDVAILLTSLSFYYAGLSVDQLQQSLKQLQRSDDPSMEYSLIIQQSKNVPSTMRSWNAINVDDEAQCNDLWKCLRTNVAVIDYFLNHFVFPRHAKTFEKKLVSSGWDIPIFSEHDLQQVDKEGQETIEHGDKKITARNPTGTAHISTGFSGTNDGRMLLPLTIQQHDLPELAHTNAEVLTYLLQPRNRMCVLAADKFGKRLSETSLLRNLCDQNIRMLIDAGAQILEMDNLELAKAWLKIDTLAAAGVYFNEIGMARVVYRDNREVPLAASPFANNLGDCVVYLDESHTRGTDLKMPVTAVGALTLGPGQTKDHTVQAAMRLRQLGTTQSVVFFYPPEVHQSMLDLKTQLRKGEVGSKFVDSSDVVMWLLEQTSNNIEQLQPLYISQGLDFCRRSNAAQEHPEATIDKTQRELYLQQLEQQEDYSLEQLYAPKRKNLAASTASYASSRITSYAKELDAMKRSLCDTADTVQGLAHSEVEQEREVAIEVETVREVQKPVHVTPARQRTLSKEILSFAQTGKLSAGFQSYQQAFAALRHTALGVRLRINDSAFTSQLYVTMDFMTTIDVQLGQPKDEFLRSVTFLLWSPSAQAAMILSPFEAEELLHHVRDANVPNTHMLTYVAPVSRSMLKFNNLDLYSIPSLPEDWLAPVWLVRELGVFAGRLYFEWNEYAGLCEFFGTTASTVNGKVGLFNGVQKGDVKTGHDEDTPIDATQMKNVRIENGYTRTTTLEDGHMEGSNVENGHTESTDTKNGYAENGHMNGETSINGHGSKPVENATAPQPLPKKKEIIEPFTARPLVFMQEWLTIRRKGQDFSQTPMGHVCRGRKLEKDSAFFASAAEEE